MGSRTVIDVEKNGVVTLVFNAADGLKNIFGQNCNPTVIEQGAVDFHQELAIPIDHFRQQFRNVHFGFFANTPEHGLERKAESQPADEDAWMRMPHQLFAREFRQKNLGHCRCGAHELPAVQLHEVFAVVLVQREPSAIGGNGLSERAEWFHLETAARAT